MLNEMYFGLYAELLNNMTQNSLFLSLALFFDSLFHSSVHAIIYG